MVCGHAGRRSDQRIFDPDREGVGECREAGGVGHQDPEAFGQTRDGWHAGDRAVRTVEGEATGQTAGAEAVGVGLEAASHGYGRGIRLAFRADESRKADDGEFVADLDAEGGSVGYATIGVGDADDEAAEGAGRARGAGDEAVARAKGQTGRQGTGSETEGVWSPATGAKHLGGVVGPDGGLGA